MRSCGGPRRLLGAPPPPARSLRSPRIAHAILPPGIPRDRRGPMGRIQHDGRLRRRQRDRRSSTKNDTASSKLGFAFGECVWRAQRFRRRASSRWIGHSVPYDAIPSESGRVGLGEGRGDRQSHSRGKKSGLEDRPPFGRTVSTVRPWMPVGGAGSSGQRPARKGRPPGGGAAAGLGCE